MLECAEHLLSFVQYLALSHAFFPWDSAAYQGLVELHLKLSEDVGSFDWPPTQNELAQILSSSPMLRNLSLVVDCLWDSHDSSIEAIPLKQLQYFTLELLDPDYCLGLLPLFAPGPAFFSLCLSLHSDPAFREEVRSLAQRSKITALHVVAEGSNSWVTPLSCHLTQLESLTLEDFRINPKTLKDFKSVSRTMKTSPWPQLQTLRLIHCQIDESSLTGLLALLQIPRC